MIESSREEKQKQTFAIYYSLTKTSLQCGLPIKIYTVQNWNTCFEDKVVWVDSGARSKLDIYNSSGGLQPLFCKHIQSTRSKRSQPDLNATCGRVTLPAISRYRARALNLWSPKRTLVCHQEMALLNMKYRRCFYNTHFLLSPLKSETSHWKRLVQLIKSK